MRDYILKRLITLIPILIGISFLSFALISLSPSNPAEVALRVNEIVPTEEAVKSMEEQLGINKPYLERYATWLTDSLHGDFGNSYVNNKPVATLIGQALPNTIKLAIVALAITIVFSVVVGILCAVYEGTIGDKLTRALVFIGTAMPSFWVGLLLIWILSVKLNLFPTS
ncbi:MAG: ABC transporter permease, partial [Intestinibacter sp.]|uniref:ABC transporter permease n=1 Tax=Intestinibacter sp. TaxID=1965304 RepID=UPI003F191D3E